MPTSKLDSDPKLDFFSVYDQPAPLLRQQAPSGLEVADAAYLDAVLRLRRWNIDPTEATEVLARINQCRADIENRPRRVTMRRPIGNLDVNRLDLILDGPPAHLQTETAWQAAIGQNRKAWQEADAAVWRAVYAKIRKTHRHVQFPNAGHTGAVQALRDLYGDLRIVTSSYQ